MTVWQIYDNIVIRKGGEKMSREDYIDLKNRRLRDYCHAPMGVCLSHNNCNECVSINKLKAAKRKEEDE